MAYFLGLDSSTQSLSALIIDTDGGRVVADKSIGFGERLPQYKSPNGFLASEDPDLGGLLGLFGSTERVVARWKRKDGTVIGMEEDGTEILRVPLREPVFIREAFDAKYNAEQIHERSAVMVRFVDRSLLKKVGEKWD